MTTSKNFAPLSVCARLSLPRPGEFGGKFQIENKKVGYLGFWFLTPFTRGSLNRDGSTEVWGISTEKRGCG